MKENKQKKSRVGLLALLVLIPLFCVSSYKVLSQLYVDHQQSEVFDSLIEQVNQARNNPDMVAQIAENATRKPVEQAEDSAAPEPVGEEIAAQRESTPSPEPITTEIAPMVTEAPTEAQVNAVAQGGSAPMAETAATEATAENDSEKPMDMMTEAPTATVVPTATPVPPMLSAYEPLYKKNKDFFGWIEIEGTVVNYPVMHTPNKPEYYLHRSFDRKEVYSGVPFLAADCFVGCGNYLIYGHHIKNGTQFAGITEYSSEDFWEEHPTIRFDTLYEVGIYDVVAAFYSKVYPDDVEDVFRYYWYTDLREEEKFTEYVSQVMDAALYETGIELQFGDQLITLSTCEYSQTDGRFVVVAKKR